MVKLPDRRRDTVDARIFRAYEASRGDWRRAHLGASQIGRPCEREVFYAWRWASEPRFDGRMLRLFETGNREEPRLVANLRDAGLLVLSPDQPPAGSDPDAWRAHFQVSWLGGRFGGTADGIARGVPEAPLAWHLLEFKTSNTKGFRELQAKGVEEAKPQHFAQMQVYMHGLHLRRALYVCVCKETDGLHVERVRYDRAFAQSMLDRAERVIAATEPPPRISDAPGWYQCSWCDHHATCHMGATPEVNCRTCAHATDSGDGTWRCDLHQLDLDADAQREGCRSHAFDPRLVPWKAVDADAGTGAIRFEIGDELIWNGAPLATSSVDLARRWAR